ncbi:unnamed protein product [Thlaspi arvense]|uniref:Uncharacterized protein n=1 Tax=Thlaspi arvense TaxID=13288 RepID=A0AAU9TDY8_THLAR|nr:unnamed protein product [Thlaspi arvense]
MGRKKKTQPAVLVGKKEIEERLLRMMFGYTDKLNKSQGFDIRGYEGISPILVAHICDRDGPCCDLVLLYARMGLHRYNLVQGKHLQLSSVKMYNRSVSRSYFITLEAKDPASDPVTLQTFQAKVNEVNTKDRSTDGPATDGPATLKTTNGFLLTCTVARRLGDTSISIPAIDLQRNHCNGKHLSYFMPELPPKNPFEDDSKRFHVLKESELQDNDDWVRLYVELAVAKPYTREEQGLDNLKILKVAMDSERYLSEGLGANDATFYIRYEDSCEARVGKDVDRVAVVRRMLDEHSQVLRLVGRHQSITPSSNAMEAGSSSAQD